MPYGNLLADVVQGSTANTPPVFKDGNGTTIGTLCRAWVNFNGTGTVAIRASFNVSSITDNGTGDYTVNFTNAMPDANYSVIGLGGSSAGNSWGSISLATATVNGTDPTTSAFRIKTLNSNASTVSDQPYSNVAVFR
jgi:hypothetical protein